MKDDALTSRRRYDDRDDRDEREDSQRSFEIKSEIKSDNSPREDTKSPKSPFKKTESSNKTDTKIISSSNQYDRDRNSLSKFTIDVSGSTNITKTKTNKTTVTTFATLNNNNNNVMKSLNFSPQIGNDDRISQLPEENTIISVSTMINARINKMRLLFSNMTFDIKEFGNKIEEVKSEFIELTRKK